MELNSVNPEEKKEKKRMCLYRFILEIFDKDTLIIGGLLLLAIVYLVYNVSDAQQVISNIVSILGGALGGSILAKKKE